MKKRQFAIPYNNDRDLLTKLVNIFPESVDYIHELYFPIPYKYGKTGRVNSHPDDYEKQVIKLIEETHKYGMLSNILLNAGCIADFLLSKGWIEELTDYLKYLKNDYGLDIITVSDYGLARVIKESVPGLKIECSSISYVDYSSRAGNWANVADIIVVPHDLTKDIDKIKMIRNAVGDTELKIMINHRCAHGCPMFISHNNIEGHGDAGEFYLNICMKYRAEHPWYIYSAGYIPPRELDLYDEYIDTYKIVDRTVSTENIIRSFGGYTFDSRYIEKTEKMNNTVPSEVYKKVLACDFNCQKCNYCEQYYKSHMC